MNLDQEGKVAARKLKGFQDYPPDLMRQRLAIMQTAREIAKRAAFSEIATPALEHAEVLLGVGGETDKQVFRFMDGGERDVALRYDLTVPFARYVSENYGKISMPFKRLQIGDVWRAEKPQKGRFREFCQCDLDIIGADSAAADIEILSTFHQILTKIIPTSFTMACNDRKILSALIYKILEVKDSGAEQQALLILDKLAKQGKASVSMLLFENLAVSESRTGELLDLILSFKQEEPAPLLSYLDDEAKKMWQRFEETIKIVQDLAQGSLGKVVMDLSIARGLAYYTGVVFETTVDTVQGFGSICSGGRYNQLAERFIDQPLPGVGGSIGVDRLTALLIEKEPMQAQAPAQVFLAIAANDGLSYAYKILKKLRDSGISADLVLKDQKLGAQFKFANKQAYPWVLTIGSDEIAAGTYSLRNMLLGTEERGLNWEALLQRLLS